MQESNLYLKQMEIGPMANFIYLIGDAKTREAAVVDPAWDVDTILKAAEGDEFVIKNVLITHSHPDHINGLEEIVNKTDAKVFINKNEVEYIKFVSPNIQKVESGDQFKIGEITITFIHTPGHTPGSQCFHIQDKLVSGDTLFINSCGRTDFPGGDPEEMYHTLTNRLMKLDNKTVLYPGHNYADVPYSTIGDEKKNNPFLQFRSVTEFLHFMRPF